MIASNPQSYQRSHYHWWPAKLRSPLAIPSTDQHYRCWPSFQPLQATCPVEEPRTPHTTQRHLHSPPAKQSRGTGHSDAQGQSTAATLDKVVRKLSVPLVVLRGHSAALPCAVPFWHVFALSLRSLSGTKPRAAPNAPLPTQPSYVTAQALASGI